MHTCEVCNAKVNELRRGRCWGCYGRWVDARPVGVGARCVTCAEKRRRVMKMVELLGGWYPMCFNCAGQIFQIEPMPPTLAALREAVSRERRRVERRAGKPDTRGFRYERRVGDRRGTAAGRDRIEDDMIVEVTFDIDGERERDLERDLDDVTHIRAFAER